ncbi:uncharacterized protein BXZ73DRAFT_76869 [Epithele typhae]|uniref:uncharacterized protein n=1 Tax=Epithele typhae TaxID=378194 RepID=UPI00200899D3|nr:uncharacterized protein BXZ73DRAFT_76869 [Epithele typhae]KAH9935169.1 hypothetical protein BXZ73DRAFT_76869 [Epithele typhae]
MFQTCTDECVEDSPESARPPTEDFLAGDVCYVHESVEAPFHDLLISSGMEAVEVPSEIVQKARKLQVKMYARDSLPGRPCVVMPKRGLSKASDTTDRICLMASFWKTDDVFSKIDAGEIAAIFSIWCLPVFYSSEHKIPIPHASRFAPQGHVHMLSGSTLRQSRVILRSFRSKNKLEHHLWKKPGHQRFSKQQLGRLMDEEAAAWRRWSERDMKVISAEAQAFQSHKYDQGTPYPSTVSTKTSRSLLSSPSEGPNSPSGQTRPPFPRGSPLKRSVQPLPEVPRLSCQINTSSAYAPAPRTKTTSEDEPGEPEPDPEPMQIDRTSASVAGASTENAGQASTPSPTDIVTSDGERGTFGKLIDSGRALVQNMGSRRRRRYHSKKANKKNIETTQVGGGVHILAMAQQKQFCPMTHMYAAVEIDPVATVDHLNDPLATAAASRLKPKTYLAYISEPVGIPGLFSDYYYVLDIIGTTLPPHEEEEGFEPEMMMVRVQPRDIGWDVDDGWMLLPSSSFTMKMHWYADQCKVNSTYARRVEAAKISKSTLRIDPAVSTTSASTESSTPLTSLTSSPTIPPQPLAPSEYLAEDLLMPTISGISEYNPVVKVAYDLPEHLPEEDHIPYPNEMFLERGVLAKIIQDSNIRNGTDEAESGGSRPSLSSTSSFAC